MKSRIGNSRRRKPDEKGREEKRRKKISEEKGRNGHKKEALGARKGRKVAKHCFSIPVTAWVKVQGIMGTCSYFYVLASVPMVCCVVDSYFCPRL